MRKKGYAAPILAAVYQWDGKKMKRVASYRTEKGYKDKLALYAKTMPEANVYVYLNHRGWHKAVFYQLKDRNGEIVDFEWELKESDGIGKDA